jgi:hypothetical protein
LRINIDINTPFDTSINQSYIPFGFYKFGICAWVYDGGYRGACEWINTQHFCTEPKYANPISLDYCLFGSTTALITPVFVITGAAPDVILNNIPYNAATGLNMPIPLLSL